MENVKRKNLRFGKIFGIIIIERVIKMKRIWRALKKRFDRHMRSQEAGIRKVLATIEYGEKYPNIAGKKKIELCKKTVNEGIMKLYGKEIHCTVYRDFTPEEQTEYDRLDKEEKEYYEHRKKWMRERGFKEK